MNTSGFFETFFNNAKYNGIIIMNTKGVIMDINEAFHMRFGYAPDELTGKNFSILFTKKDQEINKPEIELQNVLSEGSASDENYLMHKEGNKVWVTGESVLIEDVEGDECIVKVVHNIHAQKQLERFLLQSHEFVDTVFESIDESGLLLLDSRLRIVKCNKAFVRIFDIKETVGKGSRLSDINNPFWQRTDVKQDVVNFLVANNSTEKTYDITDASGNKKKVSLQGKLIEGTQDVERQLLIMARIVAS